MLNRFSTHPRLTSALAALLALLLGAFLGLALLAAGGLVAGPAAAPLAQAGRLLLPVAGMGLLVALSLASPLAALLAWLVLAPYSAHIPLDISLGAGIPDISLTRLMAGWLLLLVVVQATLGQRRLRPLAWSDLAYALFGLAMLLTVANARIGRSIALQAIFDAYLVPFVALFLARQLVRSRRDLRWTAAALLLAGAGLAFLIVREQLTGQILFNPGAQPAAYSQSFRKVQSLLGNAAPLGVTAAMTLPLGLMALVQAVGRRSARPAQRWLVASSLAVAIAFIGLGVFMTYNRASWLGAVLALLVPVLLRPSARRILLPVLLLGLLLALLAALGAADSPVISERLLEDNSIDYRGTAAGLAFDMVRRSPLLGYGYNNFGYVAATRYGYDPVSSLTAYAPAHNSYLFIAVSGGLLALLPYLAWLALVARSGLRRMVTLARAPLNATTAFQLDALAAGVALFLIYAVASGTFDNAQTGYMNLVFYAALGAVWGAASPIQAGPQPAAPAS